MATVTFSKKQLVTALVATGLFVLGFLAGYEYKAYEIRNAISDAFGMNSANEASSADPISDDGKQGLKSTYHQPNEEIIFSTQKMKFNSARSATTLTAPYSEPWVAEPNTKFVVVDHTVTNTGNSPFSFSEFELFDSEGRRYSASDEVFGKVENYIAFRELSPGVPETGISVYVVPSNSKNFEFGGKNGKTNNLDLVKFSVE